VNISADLTEPPKANVEELLEKFWDVFSDVPGLTNLEKYSIKLTTEELA